MRLPAQNPPAAKWNTSVKAPAGVKPSYGPTCKAGCLASFELCKATHGDNPLNCDQIYNHCLSTC